MEKKKTRIKVGSVSIPFYEWRDSKTDSVYWRWSWKDAAGKWKYGTRSNKNEALEAARAQCRTIAQGLLDFDTLTLEQIDLVRRFLTLDPTHEDLTKLQLLKNQKSATLHEVLQRWHTSKMAEIQNKESPHLRHVRHWLEKLAAALPGPASSISAAQLADHIEKSTTSAKSRRDGRSRVTALWKFAHTHEIFTNTEAEKLPKYREKTAVTIVIFQPAEMQTLLAACPAEFLPWLMLSGFSGLRSEEIAPNPGTKKPLRWEWIKWDRGVIDLPAECSKVRKRRLVPITATLERWLKPISKPSGIICPRLPSKHVTKILGQHIGGWRKNALRHSYGSYRAAQTKDLQALAIEMGTSFVMIEKHYREAVDHDQAMTYWDLNFSEVFRKF